MNPPNHPLIAAALLAGKHSAPVTHLWSRVVGTLVMLLVIVGIYLLMWRGWQKRQARQADIPPPPAVPADFSTPEDFFVTSDDYEATYISTTTEGDWLDRIAVHRLGERSQARVTVGPAGVWIEREPFGAPDVFIPRQAVRDVRLASGMAGKYLSEEGIVVITWEHGDRTLDTGLKPRFETEDLVRSIEAILELPATERPSE